MNRKILLEDSEAETFAAKYTSKPKVPNAHLFDMEGQSMLLSVEHGSIYELDSIIAETLDLTMKFGDVARVSGLVAAMGIDLKSSVADTIPESVPTRSLSLAVAQKCNLGCTYCYAQQGSFGGTEKSMPLDISKAAIDRLLEETPTGKTVTLAFLGGEPLVNRAVLREATEYAATKASSRGIKISFSLTTNGTLLTADDAEFFDCYAFSVTISIDGTRDKHDRLRPFKSGQGSYDRVICRAKFLLDIPYRRCRVMARVTLTPDNLIMRETLDELAALGFDGITFSPVINSSTGKNQMETNDLKELLKQMIECGREFENHLTDNKIYPFTNIISTLRRIHAYKRDAYPCGAGGGYLGVSSEGGLYACHRFVNDEQGAMGNVFDGIDATKQKRWLIERNVHKQEPCQTCWARYMCGGGCHHEAIYAGRPACDYIRGWLHYCLGVYVKLLKAGHPLLEQILTSNHLI